MVKKDLSKYLGNNKKCNNSAIVATIVPELLRETGVKSGDQIIIGKLPGDVVITGAYLVVTEAMPGFSLAVNVNGDSDNLDFTSVCATHQSAITVSRTKTVTDIYGTITIGSGITGEAHLVVEFIELQSYNGTFVE